METTMFNKTKEQLIDFEQRIVKRFENAELPYLLHLCGGNEDQLIDIFRQVKEGDWILSNHRSHYHYLLAGGNEDELEKKILEGESMHIFDKKINFMTTSILAGMAPIAVGIAMSLKMDDVRHSLGGLNYVWCFIGDGAEEEGHFYEAVRYVDGWDLPCRFIIEDNDRSVASSKKDRYGDSIMDWPNCVYRYNYTPTFPHAGTGSGKMVDLSKFIKE
jgi:pyruvate dehydrogenase E1 component alpha subunit